MISAALIEYLKKGIFTVLGIIVAVYLFIILLTYTGNDPSWSHISSDMTTINNMGGSMGAWLSDLLFSFFGYSAWWLLAFLVYESILIWWDNKPTFWLLRIVAYVFLILSASALFAQIVALIQHVVDPVASGLNGIAGGIIGLELQVRLSQLLSQWGSVAFLTVFVIITATFAFNIHWLTVYHKFTNLSWLGSGVKPEHDINDSVPSNTGKHHYSDESITAPSIKEASNRTKNNESDHEQLPLELQPAYQIGDAADNSGRFSHVLTDFLAKSGLGASVKATVAANAVAQSAIADQTMKHTVSTPISFSGSDSSQSTPTVAQARKVEPSFAWNDANIVDDLLSNHPTTTQNIPAPAEPNISSTELSTPLVEYNDSDDREVSGLKTQHVIDEATSDDIAIDKPVVDNVADNMVINDAMTSETGATDADVTELADTWLSEHAPASAVTFTSDNQSRQQDENPVAESVIKDTLEENQEEITEHKGDKEAQASITPLDMTPTNTPPANPAVPPKSAPTATITHPVDSSTAATVEPIVAHKPTISFSIPEGDTSNHIIDMMPEYGSDDEQYAPVMPDIHDDAAFSQRSRAMQTAKYRAHLTPVPEMAILDKPDPNRQPSYTIVELEQLSELLEIKLQEFNVKAQVVNAIPGPVVTRFEVELAPGIKASKVTGISRDLARSLSMASLRVVEVIPGKPYIGIEVPNKQREMVRLIELLDTEKFKDPSAQISMAMGKDIGGKEIITDLARAPHMLVAGTTGSGKSVLVNAMLLSMLLKYTPNELRLILIDPKQLELANYNDIPHLLTPVVTDMTEAASSLSWCVAEMERRYQLMSLLKVRKLNEFNKKVVAAEKAGKPMLDPLWRPNDNVSISQAPKLKTLPMIVIVADEFADMIMQVGKQAEELITRLAQKSRAAGIHLILATQRPSVDVITGLIKANIPVRAALRVNSKVDSRTILDSGGAEDMLGNGDMLFLGPGQIEPDRVHGAYVSDEEVNSVCDAWRERGAPDYIDNMSGNFELSSSIGSGSTGSPSGEDDDLYNDAVAFIMETRKVSASSIQRKFSIGYNRAARIVDSMEEAGLVSSMGKSGKRELLM